LIIRCRYCGKILYRTEDSSDRYTMCKYSRPDCEIEYTNFFNSMRNAESSSSEFVRNIHKEILIRLKDDYPKQLKPLLKVVLRKKYVEKLFVVKSK